jgi:hypothetical protein
MGSNSLMRFFSKIRQRAGMAAMFANLSNAVQQVAGVSLAAVRVNPTALLSAAAQYAINPKKMSASVASLSPFMAERMHNEIASMNDAINDVLLNPSGVRKAEAWTNRHAFFLQTAVDNVLTPIIWTGAYNHAVAQAPKDLTDTELQTYARRFADSTGARRKAVRCPKTSRAWKPAPLLRACSRSSRATSTWWANLLGTEYKTLIRETGLRKGAGRGLYLLFIGFLAPAWSAEIIAQLFAVDQAIKTKTVFLIDDWLASVFGWGTLRNATALVPVVGQGVNAVVNAFNDKPYDDRLATSPAVSMLETAARAPYTIYKAVEGDDPVNSNRLIHDVATLLTMTIGVPAAPLAAPLATPRGWQTIASTRPTRST